MRNAEALTREQIQAFLKGNEGIEFSGQNRRKLYAWARQVLVAQEYAAQDKQERGAIRTLVSKMTGLSRAQTTRLIGKYLRDGGPVPANARMAG